MWCRLANTYTRWLLRDVTGFRCANVEGITRGFKYRIMEGHESQRRTCLCHPFIRERGTKNKSENDNSSKWRC
uniref:AMP dependent CoA ligase n=1 Tax=Rhizophora mucronata TaxID=61149 RepID=A0A2P2LMK2_RHIMU